MKFKSLLKIGLPILGVSALAITLPLTLTSCSDSDSKTESVNLTPVETNVPITEDNLDKTQTLKLDNVPDSWKNKNVTYKWFIRSTEQNAKVSLSSDEWTHLTDTEEPKLDIQPIFTIGGDLMGKEFKAEAYEDNQKIGETSSMSFEMPKDFQPANDVPTSLDNIKDLHDQWAGILKKYNANFQTHLNDIHGAGWNLVKPTTESVGTSTYADDEESLFNDIASILGVKDIDNIESITIHSNALVSPLDSDGTIAEIPNVEKSLGQMSVVVNIKEGEKPEGLNYSDLNLWSGNLYYNQPKNTSLYEFTDTNDLVVTNLVPVFQTLSLTANPNKVPVEGAKVNFEVDATYFNPGKIKLGKNTNGSKVDQEGEFFVSFRLFNIDGHKPVEITNASGQGEITKYNFEVESAKPGNYRVIGEITDESGALVSIMGADAVIIPEDGTIQPTEVSPTNNISTIESKFAELNDSNKDQIAAILDNSGSNWTVKEGKINDFAKEVLGIDQEGVVKSITLTQGTPKASQSATVSITVELNDDFAWASDINDTWGVEASGKTITLSNIKTGIPSEDDSASDGETEPGESEGEGGGEGDPGVPESQSTSTISRFFNLFKF